MAENLKKTPAEAAIAARYPVEKPALPGTAAVTALRDRAFGTVDADGLPHRRVEEWRYTDLKANLKTVPAASRLLMTQHTAIFEAVRDKKPQAARSAAETHIDFVRETLAQTLRSVARRETAERRLSSEFSPS